MTDAITFNIPGETIGKGRPRVTRSGHAFTPAKTRNFEALVRLLAAEAMSGQAPLDEPVTVRIAIVLPAPTSWPKKRQAAALAGEVLPCGRPDLDNQVKAILDGMNTVVFTDDARIVEIVARKFYGEVPGATITVSRIDGCPGPASKTAASPPAPAGQPHGAAGPEPAEDTKVTAAEEPQTPEQDQPPRLGPLFRPKPLEAEITAIWDQFVVGHFGSIGRPALAETSNVIRVQFRRNEHG